MSMRVFVRVTRTGLKLAEPVTTPEGLPLFGRGTTLEGRHLQILNDMGVDTVTVEDDPRLGPWEVVPDPEAWLAELERRFAPVIADRRMVALKDAVRDVYLDGLLRPEGS